MSALLVAAIVVPGPLYLAALVLFGLPHVVWELGFLRSRYAARWPSWWWRSLLLLLVIQAAVRGAAWADLVSGMASQISDVLTLCALMLMVVCAPSGTRWQVRVSALVAGLVLYFLLEQGDVIPALLVLAIVHNFTPLALIWDLARDQPQAAGEARLVTGLFMLPIALALAGLIPGFAQGYLPELALPGNQWLQSQLPERLSAAGRSGQFPLLLSALVLAQCLHYWCVLELLPRVQQRSAPGPLLPRPVRQVTFAVVAAMVLYYVLDFGAARQLYGVAAGLHAWLEWPILLMTMLRAHSLTEASS